MSAPIRINTSELLTPWLRHSYSVQPGLSYAGVEQGIIVRTMLADTTTTYTLHRWGSMSHLTWTTCVPILGDVVGPVELTIGDPYPRGRW